MKINVVELFAGVGGFRVGLNHIKSFDKKSGKAKENGDWEFVWANQWEPSTSVQHAFNCYQTRFGTKENHSNEDIASVSKASIPEHDLLVGGFPCQDYSVARSLSNESGIAGKKGVLWWQILDAITEKETKFILLENVDRLLKSPASNRGRDFAIMLKSLSKDYIVEWRVVNAGEYGMPQKRRRVFIFAYKKDTQHGINILKVNENFEKNDLLKSGLFNKVFPIKLEGEIQSKNLNLYSDLLDITENYPATEKKFENTGIMIDGFVYHSNFKEESEAPFPLKSVIKKSSKFTSSYDDYLIKDWKKWEYLKDRKSIDRVSKTGHKYKYSEGKMSFPDCTESPGRTMLTSEGTVNRSSHIIAVDSENNIYRTITEIEAEMLNMFPADWTNTGMTKRNRYFMMGNALVTGIISKVEPSLFDIISLEYKIKIERGYTHVL